ncbi:hypothetical protein D9M70_635130 [compost metagenome]
MLGALTQHGQHMGAGVHLGVMLGRLRHAEQLIQLRQPGGEGATVAQHLDELVRARLHQGAGNFFPAAFRSQGVKFAGFGDVSHQLQGFLGHGEAQWCIARGETRHPQYPQGILGEGRGDMA